MTVAEVPPQRHVVVFDCNVYLDVAHLIGEPYAPESFDKHAAQLVSEQLPAGDSRHDSLRVIAACTSGRFAGSEPVEIWTSAHIDRMVRNKAVHPSVANRATGFRGLGWSQEHAEALVSDFVHRVVDSSGGGSIGQTVPDGEPPLDHEDGLVYGACREIVREDALCKSYCVTNDQQFLRDHKDGRLPNHTVVLAPAQFLALIRSARTNLAARNMKRSQ